MKTISETQHITTLAGKIQAQEVVIFGDLNLRLPEFDENMQVSQSMALVIDNDKVKYNLFLGTYFLLKTGIKLNYSEGNMEWLDCSIP
jgi:hypothetical protein